jgi:sugar lactone lactonase YvrE
MATGVIAVATVVATLTATLASAGPSEAQPSPDHQRPASWAIPGDRAFPEGIARDQGQPFFYTGSTTDGTVFRGDLRSGQTEPFLPGGVDGRTTTVGMKVDTAGRLIIAGGDTGIVWVYDTESRALLHTFVTGTPGSFLNDMAIAANGDVYVTDSFQPTLYRIPVSELAPQAPATATLRPGLDLRDTVIRYQDGFNLNGIAVTPDQRHLVVADTNDGALYRIHRWHHTVTRIDLHGEVVTGDGLLITGSTLYAVSSIDGNHNVVNVVTLDADHTTGTLRERATDPRLRGPSTAAFDGDRLLVVNFQLGANPPTLPFTVVAIPRPVPGGR